MPPIRVALAVTLACLALAGLGEAASATTRVCRQIEAELASSGDDGSSARVRQHDRAISRQREQMAIARGQARDADCGYATFGASVRKCAAINATLDRMLANLDKLERERDRLARSGQKRSKAALLAELDAKGCRDEPPVADQPATPLAEMLARALQDDPYGEAPADEAPFGDGETYRTMCVRGCDGYFYPMSNAATVGDFDRDQKNCDSSCPGADMTIYYDATHSGEPAQMVSTRSGAAYSSLPTAFRHQDASIPRDPQCGCGVAKNFEIIAGTPPPRTLRGPQDSVALPVPTPRPDPAATVAAVPGDTSAESEQEQAPPAPAGGSIISIEPPQRPEPAMPEPEEPRTAEEPVVPKEPRQPAEVDPNRQVRVVGPRFLPDPEGAIDLKGPAPTAAP